MYSALTHNHSPWRLGRWRDPRGFVDHSLAGAHSPVVVSQLVAPYNWRSGVGPAVVTHTAAPRAAEADRRTHHEVFRTPPERVEGRTRAVLRVERCTESAG